MTKLLSFDLAYSGDTGWVVWDDEKEYPVVASGAIKPKGKTDYKKVRSLYMILFDMIYQWRNTTSSIVDFICYEQTDWHRSINDKSKNANVEFAKERRAQWSLGMANAIMLVAASMNVPEDALIPVGAMEAKREFGSITKKGVAELLANEYPQYLRFDAGKDDYLWDLDKNEAVPDHVSDAMAIASVVAKRIRQNELGRME